MTVLAATSASRELAAEPSPPQPSVNTLGYAPSARPGGEISRSRRQLSCWDPRCCWVTRAGSTRGRGPGGPGCRLPSAVVMGTDPEQASSGDPHVDVRRRWYCKASKLQPRRGSAYFAKLSGLLLRAQQQSSVPSPDRAGPHQACGMAKWTCHQAHTYPGLLKHSSHSGSPFTPDVSMHS